ncbi:MAG: GNAT family N-acetyltransferase [Caryophanon sp.]|nr:GNAT family N-acetyltransferase [Caryophanon sp.]
MMLRLANIHDIEQLIQLRWQQTEELIGHAPTEETFDAFAQTYRLFLEDVLPHAQWKVWVAEVDGKIVAHIYAKCIQRVPVPGVVTKPYVYLSNAYTTPAYRARGLQQTLLAAVNAWVTSNGYEFSMLTTTTTTIEQCMREGEQISSL